MPLAVDCDDAEAAGARQYSIAAAAHLGDFGVQGRGAGRHLAREVAVQNAPHEIRVFRVHVFVEKQLFTLANLAEKPFIFALAAAAAAAARGSCSIVCKPRVKLVLLLPAAAGVVVDV